MSITITLVPLSLALIQLVTVEAITGACLATVGSVLYDKLGEASDKSIHNKMSEKVFETKFANKELLIEALSSIGLCPIIKDKLISCETNDYKLVFNYENNKYYLKVLTTKSFDEVLNKYGELDISYGKIVQADSVKKIKENVKNSSVMELLSETVLDDNSVVLTISV